MRPLDPKAAPNYMKRMQAVAIRRFGGPEVLDLVPVDDPAPGRGEVVVRVRASGVNRADLLQRRGLYPPPPGASEVPGLEFAGVVVQAGPDARRWAPGRRVMGIVAGGGYAERVVVHETAAVEVPEGMDLLTAGAVPEAYMTAYDAVFRQGRLAAGQTLLVHAVGSGVGLAALQMARRAGARVVGTSRTASKLERASKLGLDAGVHAAGEAGGAGREDWREAVREAVGGRGADVILDLVGGPYLAGNQAVLAPRGRHVVVGVPGGSRAEIDLRALMVRRARMMGTVLRARSTAEKAELAREFSSDVLPGLADGSLAPVLDAVFPPERAADAHRRMESNENFGKMLLDWNAD